MKRSFSGITAQQAPMPRAARQAAVSLPETVQIASRMPHLTSPNSIFAIRNASSSVVIVEGIDANKLARSQRSRRPPAPVLDRAKEREFRGASTAELIGQ